MHTLKDQTVRLLTRDLAAIGWTEVKRMEPAFAMVRTSDVVFDLRLNLSESDDGIRMYPAIGARHVETSRLVGQFKGRPPTTQASTFGIGLADLLHENGIASAPFERWTIHSETQLQSVVDVFCEDLTRYGLPFLESLSTLEDILARLETEPRSQIYCGMLAVGHALLGNMSRALTALHEYAVEAQSQQPPMSVQSWGFIQSFVDHFKVDEKRLGYRIGPAPS
jgi:hypothetical protein